MYIWLDFFIYQKKTWLDCFDYEKNLVGSFLSGNRRTKQFSIGSTSFFDRAIKEKIYPFNA